MKKSDKAYKIFSKLFKRRTPFALKEPFAWLKATCMWMPIVLLNCLIIE